MTESFLELILLPNFLGWFVASAVASISIQSSKYHVGISRIPSFFTSKACVPGCTDLFGHPSYFCCCCSFSCILLRYPKRSHGIRMWQNILWTRGVTAGISIRLPADLHVTECFPLGITLAWCPHAKERPARRNSLATTFRILFFGSVRFSISFFSSQRESGKEKRREMERHDGHPQRVDPRKNKMWNSGIKNNNTQSVKIKSHPRNNETISSETDRTESHLWYENF